MGIQKLILNIVLKVECLFLSLLRIKNDRITFISLESTALTQDFLLIYTELDKIKYNVKTCLIHHKNNSLKGQFQYFLNCFKQLYYVYTSRLIILNDNNYVVSNFKREGVIVLQVWHACGAIKKFGNVIERKYPISHYDYVLSTSSYWKSPYSKAFSVEEKNVIPIGMARNDELFNKEKVKQYRISLLDKYPLLKGRKIILYAPTFRGNIYKGFSTVEFDALSLLNKLGEDYVILYKFHPLLGNIKLANHERIINMNHEDTHQLFCICDYMISDYSSIVFDYMILEKPMIFFVPDLKEYENDLGVFVDIEKLGFPIAKTMNELYECIKDNFFDINVIKKCKNQFFDYQDNQSVKRIIDFIEEIM